MKINREFSEKEQNRFNHLLKEAYDLIDWSEVQKSINIHNEEGSSDEFWEVYETAVTPIADPATALVEAGIELTETDDQMFSIMAEDTNQNPGKELKYWSHCQDYNWDLFCKIVDILKEEGY